MKRRWPSLVDKVPCVPRSSPLGTKVEMIVAGCGDRKASASPDRTVGCCGCGPSHIWLAPCRLQHATYTLQSIIWAAPANTVVVLWTTAIPLCVSPSSKFPRHAKGIESRHVGNRHRASGWCILRCYALVEPRLLAPCQQHLHDLPGSSQGMQWCDSRAR